MHDLKGLQDLFRTLRLAETASYLPELIKKDNLTKKTVRVTKLCHNHGIKC